MCDLEFLGFTFYGCRPIRTEGTRGRVQYMTTVASSDGVRDLVKIEVPSCLLIWCKRIVKCPVRVRRQCYLQDKVCKGLHLGSTEWS